MDYHQVWHDLPLHTAYGLLHQWQVQTGHATAWPTEIQSRAADVAKIMASAFSED